jgi:segregation and condensation protein B
MSLKAKLEAVIYAAEEPVTLTQLAFLFSAEALEWKAQQEAARAAEAARNAEAAAQPPVNADFDYVDTDEGTAAESPEDFIDIEKEMAAQVVDAPAAVAEETTAAPEAAAPVESPEPAPEPAAEPAEPESEHDSAQAEAESRRQSRQQDREVRAILRQLLDELIDAYAVDGRGIEIREIAGGYRMATKPEYHDAVRAFVKSLKPALKLSMPALETLAVIAYKQPVTAPEVNEIRGVDSSAVFGSLLARKLIATAGRKPVIGRPILYKTTREFLLRFGLKDVSELPSMEEFEKLAASELEEIETAPESESALESSSAPEPASEPATPIGIEIGPLPTVPLESTAAPAEPSPTASESSSAPEPPASSGQSSSGTAPASNPSEAPPPVPE